MENMITESEATARRFIKNGFYGTLNENEYCNKLNDNNRQKVIINIGIPASGKSSWTEYFLSENSNYVRVSRDSFRYMLRNEGYCQSNIERMITEMHNSTIITALVNGYNVIIDNTNVKLSVINELVKLVNGYAEVSYNIFDTPLEVCIERDAKRERKVGKEIIEQMHQNYEILMKNLDLSKINLFKR